MLKKTKKINQSRFIAIVFLVIILIGTMLLSLPISSRTGKSCGIISALFTATSATCVTGLVVGDTYSLWSSFGQVVIITLVEIGGIGFMSVASVFIFSLRKKANLGERLVMAQSVGLDDLGDVSKIQKMAVAVSLGIEAVGAVILTLRFLPEYGLKKAAGLGAFHSISAYCNAGFDIFGFKAPGSSLALYHTDPIVCLTLSAVIVLGGLGFFVWFEILNKKHFKKLSVYSKLVLLTTLCLLICGSVMFCIFEWNNPETIGQLSAGEKIFAGIFQSATARTAGFAGMNQSGLTDCSKAETMFLMLIGGSSGSTAGGLKTVTFVVLVMFLVSRARGKNKISVFHRTVSNADVLNAITIFSVMIVLVFFGSVFLCACDGVGLTDAAYECTSAIATVGLTTGITPSLSVYSKILLIIYMYFGRVGILTISLGFLTAKKADTEYRYAKTNLLIG